MLCKITWLLLLIFWGISASSQIAPPCTTLGQLPQTAFPVCGSQTFVQSTVPFCVNHAIPVPGCNNDYADVNPFWYKFTCYKSGTLAFTINPIKQDEDYDWQIFDVTGHDVNEVYEDQKLVVGGNWTGTFGPTGASSQALYSNHCASDPRELINPFSTMPNLIAGHQYLLLVSHYTRAPNGYTLNFAGGTAVITDTTQAHFKSAVANCDASSITVILNKKLTCKSVAPNGSDFALNTNVAKVIAAEGVSCSSGFDMDSITVQLSKPLVPGKYTLFLRTGSDNNTLLDYCDNPMAEGDSVQFEVFGAQPTPFDSIAPVGCSPNVIQLVFKKRMRCSSIAENGSDFTITGPTPVTITGADGNCNKGLSYVVNIHLASPIKLAGNYQVNIKHGDDGNTLIDECGEEVIPSSRGFITHDTVSAAFKPIILYGCKTDTVVCTNAGGNGITNWAWTFAGGYTTNTQNATALYTRSYWEKIITLAVTNGTCSDTATTTVYLDNYLKAAFNASTSFACPGDKVVFTDTSEGKITGWYWNFGNGLVSTQQSPELVYPLVNMDEDYKVSLTVQNKYNCLDTAYKPIKVLYSCYIAVPTAFTPNGDGLNDYLYPLNAYKTTSLTFKVFNRFGQIIFSTTDWTKKWDGTYKGNPQPTGTYVWLLSYTHTETKQHYFLRGTTVLIR